MALTNLTRPKLKGEGAAVVEGMDFGGAVFAQPVGHFVIGNDRRPGAFGQAHGVGQMVLVAVGDQDVIGADGIEVNAGGQRDWG